MPDDVVIKLLIEAIDHIDFAAADDMVAAFGNGPGYVLDGFPRTVAQAEALKKVLKDRGEKIDKVILINTPNQVVCERLAARRSCPDPLCGAVYNIFTKAPKIAGKCDLCGRDLVIRVSTISRTRFCTGRETVLGRDATADRLLPKRKDPD